MPRLWSLLFLVGGPWVVAGCGSAETNGSERPGLGRHAGDYDAHIKACGTPGQGFEAGLWLTVANDLPVIRQDGEIVSQTFLEAEVVAHDRHHLGDAARDRNRRGRSEADSDDDHDAAPLAPALRYLFEGRVLSESGKSFWISPQQLDALVDRSGGEVWFIVKDSVQVSTFPFPLLARQWRGLPQGHALVRLIRAAPHPAHPRTLSTLL